MPQAGAGTDASEQTNVWGAFNQTDGLERLADHLSRMEGSAVPGTNNPGNLKDPQTGTFRRFATPEQGRAALVDQLRRWRSVFPDWTVADLNRRYAPDKSHGGDNPDGTEAGRNRYLMKQLFPSAGDQDAATQKVSAKGSLMWPDFAKQLDPHMPLDQYDVARRQYFENEVAPRLQSGESSLATWQLFKQRTERPQPSLGTRLAMPFAETGATALAAAARPLSMGGPDFGRVAEQAAGLEKYVYGRGAEYGAPRTLPKMAGELIGALPAVALTAATGGAAAEALFPELAEAAEAAKTLQTAQKAFKAGTATAEEVKTAMAAAKAAKAAVPVYQHAVEGGLAWGALNTIQAEPDENRWVAGARGLVYGGLAGSALGWLGKLRAAGHTQESADALSRGLLSGDPAGPPATLAEDATLAKEITDSKQASDVSGAPGQVVEATNPHVDEPPANVPAAGVSVRLRTAPTQRWPQGRDIKIRVIPGKEQEAVEQIRNLVRQGGVHVKTLYNPQSGEDLARFLAALKGEDVSPHVVETAPGEAETVAREMRVNGDSADALNDRQVLALPKFAEEPTNDAIRAKVAQLRDTDENGQTAELTKFQKDAIGTAVKKMWDPEVADGKKENLINGILRGHNVDDILPEQWRSEYRVMTAEEREAEAALGTEEARGVEERQRAFEEMQGREEVSREPGEVALGGWFTKDLKTATSYGPMLLGVDVPSDVAEATDISRPGQSIHSLPKSWEDKVRWLGDLPKEPPAGTVRLYRGIKDVKYAPKYAAEVGAEGELRELGTPIQAPEPRPLNRYQEVEPLLRRDEPRELLESAPPEIQQGLLAEQYATEEQMQHTVPPSERFTLEVSPNGNIVRRMKGPFGSITLRPFRTALRVSRESMEKLAGGAKGFTAPAGYIGMIADKLGISQAPAEMLSRIVEDRPEVVFRPFLTRPFGALPTRTLEKELENFYTDWGTVYHESLHTMGHHVDSVAEIMRTGDKVTDQVARGISQWPTYVLMAPHLLNEEAFTHLATAIRMGRAEDLAEYVRMDGTVNDVLEMVNGKAKQIKESLKWTTIDSAQTSIIDRRMSDMIRRTSADPLHDLITSTEGQLKDYRYDPESRTWYENDRAFQNRKQLLDHVEKQAKGAEMVPKLSILFEARGVRGPINPPDAAPVTDTMPAVEDPLPAEWEGWSRISHPFRTTEGSMASTDKRLNAVRKGAGLPEIPLYSRWFKADEGQSALEQWQPPRANTLAEAVGRDKKKWPAMMDTLAADPKYREEMGRQHNLNADDLEKVKAQEDWAEELKTATNGRVDTMDYLRNILPKTRQFKNPDGTPDWEKVFGLEKPKVEQSFFERLLREGRIDPRMKNVGAFLNTVLKQAAQERFLEKPLTDLEKLANRKATDGTYVLGLMREPVVNYVKYMRGFPDQASQAMYKTMDEFLGKLNQQIGRINERMPTYAQIPEFNAARTTINQLMAWSYAAGIGAKAAVPVRDMMQGFILAMPTLGPARFLRGMMRGLSREGYSFARENGALLGRHTIADLVEITDELPPNASMNRITQVANKIMAWSRGAHNVVRSTIFNAMHDDEAMNAIREYRAGRMSWEEFIDKRNTSLWATSEGFQNVMKGRMADAGFSDQEIAKSIARQTVDMLAFPYRRGAQPAILRTGAGRILGQYAMWPLNFIELTKNMGFKFKSHPGPAMTTFATWAAANYAASHAMNAMGLDQGKWYWMHPAEVSLSPHAQLLIDMGKMWGDTPEDRDARRRVVEYPINFFPGAVELENILHATHSGETLFDGNGLPGPGLWRTLGFKPLKEQPEPERDLEQQALYDVGLTEKPTGDIVPTLVERERSPR